LDVLDARMDQFGLDREHYGWYRDFRRYGTVPHAGFGLGFARLIVYVCGLSNIRDAIPYPRAPGIAEYCADAVLRAARPACRAVFRRRGDRWHHRLRDLLAAVAGAPA